MADDTIDNVPPAALIKRYAVRAGLAIAASLGVAGLVALLGAAILYVRLTALEVPADQALAVIENGELVVFGAVSSVLFILLGAAAVVLVYLIDRCGKARPGMAAGLIFLVAVAMAWAVWTSDDVGTGTQVVLTVLLLVAWILGSALSVLWAVVPQDGKSALRELVAERKGGPDLVLKLRAWWWPITLSIVAAELLVAGGMVATHPVLGVQMLLAFVLGLGLLRVAALTGERFPAYGIAVFVGVSVFAAAANAVRTFKDPVAQPVALVRKGDASGLCGLYVAETAKRIYVARTDLTPGGSNPSRGRLFWVARDDVTAMSIGHLQDVETAVGGGTRLAEELLDDALPADAKPPTEKYRITTTSTKAGVKTVDVAEGTRAPSAPAGAPKPTLPATAAAPEPCGEAEDA